MCALQAPTGDKYCGLICKVSDPDACNRKAGSTCKKVQMGIGLCTYDETRAPALQLLQQDLTELVEMAAELLADEALKEVMEDVIEASWI